MTRRLLSPLPGEWRLPCLGILLFFSGLDPKLPPRIVPQRPRRRQTRHLEVVHATAEQLNATNNQHAPKTLICIFNV